MNRLLFLISAANAHSDATLSSDGTTGTIGTTVLQQMQQAVNTAVASVFKRYVYEWQAITADKPGNSAGWTLTGAFTATTMFKGGVTSFQIDMYLFPPVSDVQAVSNVYQTWIQFQGWDTSAQQGLFNLNNAVCAFYLTGNSKAWTTVNYPVNNSCGAAAGKDKLNTITKGGYSAVQGPNVTSTCVNPWDANTKSSMFVANGQLVSSCTMSRPFVFEGASTIKVGQTVTYFAGFHKWPNQTTGPDVQRAALGISTTLYWVIVDEASLIALTTAVSAALVSIVV